MITLPFSAQEFHARSQALIVATRQLSARGWTPATSSNFSARLDAKHAVITVSGRDKGQLTEADFMAIDMRGQAVASEHRPSAETLLHTQLYLHRGEIGCVLHTHSLVQTVASRWFARQGHVELAGYELLKALRGFDTHDTVLKLPVLSNSQDMVGLSEAVERHLEHPHLHGYLIEGHGLYTWGADIGEAMRHLEALEFMLAAELELQRLPPRH